MKNLAYQQKAVTELVDKTIRLLNLGGHRNKLVFEATTGAGKTFMACQMLARLMDELRERGDSRYQEVTFIWFAPRKLHLQSYEKLKSAFSETRTLRPVMFDELDQNEGIRPGEILFINWESVNKENNVMVCEGDCSLSLYEITDKTQEEFGLPIVVIIDEEHMFWSKTADKSAAVLDKWPAAGRPPAGPGRSFSFWAGRSWLSPAGPRVPVPPCAPASPPAGRSAPWRRDNS